MRFSLFSLLKKLIILLIYRWQNTPTLKISGWNYIRELYYIRYYIILLLE
jgi:hypothetical protein